MNILFRSDSSSEIGIGHIMRDLVLASQFVYNEIIFACQDLDGHIMDKIPFKVEVLHSHDKEELVKLIKKIDIDFLVIDHYKIDDLYEKYVKDKTGVKILSFDGSYRKHYCDFLLNQNIYADAKKYQDKVPSFCKVFCGLEFALIRDEFKKEKNLQAKIDSEYIKVLVTLGGADPQNKTLKILEKLEKVVDARVEIITVIGGANPYKKVIESFIKSSKHKHTIIVDAKNMASLMRGVNFAISSAGSTTIELLYMEIPFFTLSIASNQDLSFRYLIENDLAFDFNNFAEKFSNLIVSKFKINRSIEIGTKNLAQEII